LQPFHDHEFTSIEEEIQFTDALADLVQTHANTIPVLARGFLECRKYISPEAVTKFLDEHLRARIGTRLIAEQHIALHLSSQPHSEDSKFTDSDTYIGVIDTALRPATILTTCEAFVGELCELRYGVRPSIIVNGAPDTTIAHIPMHLEYILTELLKNAFRATVESGNEREPVEITIAVSTGDPTQIEDELFGDTAAASRKIGGGASGPGDETLTMRIRDRGGGIAPENLHKIWQYSFTTFREGATNSSSLSTSYGNDALNTISASGGETSTIAGLGYGLPLSRAYAEYFGGSIKLESLWGWGTDVYLTLKGLKGIDRGECRVEKS
jgi:signal transduction histidine kinase